MLIVLAPTLAFAGGSFDSGGGLTNPLGSDLDLGGKMIESNSGGIQFDSNDDGTTDHIMTSGGNVGIGSTNPGVKLDINGAVRGDIFAPVNIPVIEPVSNKAIRFKLGRAFTVTSGECYTDTGTVVVTPQECNSAYASCTNIAGQKTCDSNGETFTFTDTAIAADAGWNVGIGTVASSPGNLVITINGERKSY
ncbi:MAG TPA: hypothetical protein V6D12_14215 [Candidatus Obscuribacterales bacterium]